MASQTFYVDELLKAEEEANKIIKAAQKLRDQRLKEAKNDAQTEIQRYRQQKEAEFKKLQMREEDKQYEEDLRQKTDRQIEQIRSDFNRNKDSVVKMLVQSVLNVDLQIPISIRQKFTKKDFKA